MNGIAGKVAIVTGASGVIGGAIARAFHTAGAKVVAADVDEAAGTALAAALAPGVRFHRTDITRDDDIAACVEATAAGFGGIDFLVNVACSYRDQGLRSSRAEWLHSLDVNLVGGAIFVREVWPHMRRRGGGAIVNLSSIAGKFGQAGRALYPAAKAAIFQLTRNEAMELAADHIRVNAVSPGWTWSNPVIAATKGDRAKADRIAAEYHPLGRIGDPEDVARAVLFLCSDDAGNVTGIDFPVDGGYAMVGADRGHPATGRLAE